MWKRPMRRSYGRRKKRRMSRRRYGRRLSRRVIKNFLRVKRTFYSGTWTWGTAATGDFWKYYTNTLADLPSNAEFASVFDEYRIRAIKYTFRPNTDAVVGLTYDVNTATTNQYQPAYMHTCIDPMSTLVPAGVYGTNTLNTFLENSGVRSRRLNKATSVYFRPILTDGVTGSGTAAGKVSNKTWIRTSDTAAAYRGFHAFIQPHANTAAVYAPRVDVFITFYMEFKNVR